MSAKTSGSAVRLFVEKVRSNGVLQKQTELKGMITGPLALAREKLQILDTDEALTVLTRIDADYSSALKKSVTGIYYEELETANQRLIELDSILKELQDLLDTIGQRIYSEKRKSQDVSLVSSVYEDARSVLVYLKLKTNVLRCCLETSLEEPVVDISPYSVLETEEGNFLLSWSKLEMSCSMLQ